MNILLVEQDAETADYLEEIILNVGGVPSPVIHRAADGEQGYNMMSTLELDLVVTAVNLPVYDGISLLTSFREYNTTTPVLVVCKPLPAEHLARLRELNVHTVLFKPFRDEHVYKAVSEALNLPNG